MLKRLRASLSTDVIFRRIVYGALFILLTVLIVSNYGEGLGNFADALGITGGIMAFYVSFLNLIDERSEKRRLNKIVSIHLYNVDSQEDYILPFGMRRGDLTRAELLGYIGMIPTPGEEKVFVKLPWLSQPTFFEDLEKVKNGEDDHIVIRCTQSEFDQFDFAAAAWTHPTSDPTSDPASDSATNKATNDATNEPNVTPSPPEKQPA
jgi:hypothetical protein